MIEEEAQSGVLGMLSRYRIKYAAKRRHPGLMRIEKRDVDDVERHEKERDQMELQMVRNQRDELRSLVAREQRDE